MSHLRITGARCLLTDGGRRIPNKKSDSSFDMSGTTASDSTEMHLTCPRRADSPTDCLYQKHLWEHNTYLCKQLLTSRTNWTNWL